MSAAIVLREVDVRIPDAGAKGFFPRRVSPTLDISLRKLRRARCGRCEGRLSHHAARRRTCPKWLPPQGTAPALVLVGVYMAAAREAQVPPHGGASDPLRRLAVFSRA